jgi:glutaminyl-tRNA synthetase
MSSSPAGTPPATTRPTHFLRQQIERDLDAGTFEGRRFDGMPGSAAALASAPIDGARIRTRFPPEPNGYLHVGHAKAICLNFGLAEDFGGICHLRMDDTNPEKEEQEYVDAILEAVRWLGFDWNAGGTSHLYRASDCFDFMYEAAEALTTAGLAYVDEQSAEEMRRHRGDFATPGTPSVYRDRAPAANLARLREMRAGAHAEGAMVLRAKIDLASPNINLRDPTLYRIRHARHHHTGDRWCIYPMYTYAHPIEDALERITHSICTLEFEDQRPFYDWLLGHLADLGLLARPLPRQFEFGRLNLTHVMTSKRKLKALVDEGLVSGWDDPRMPTLFGLRRRGYTPQSIRAMADATGASKTNVWIDHGVLEQALRDHLDPLVPRAMAVLEPLALELVNWAEVFGSPAHAEPCEAPAHPQRPELGVRRFGLAPRVWIDASDFEEVPPKGFFRLFPGQRVRLKYGWVVECTGCTKDAAGRVTAVQAKVVPDTKSGTPGAAAVKVKGTITWVSAHDGERATVRLYEHLFRDAQPDVSGDDWRSGLAAGSEREVQAVLEPGTSALAAEARVQFERHGYFVADRVLHRPGAGAVFNRITGLKAAAGAPGGR